jgi:uncharacterized membrane protein YdfJ with MMPL/SSD domain
MTDLNWLVLGFGLAVLVFVVGAFLAMFAEPEVESPEDESVSRRMRADFLEQESKWSDLSRRD